MSTVTTVNESTVAIAERAAAIADAAAVLVKPKRKKPAPKHDFKDGRGKVFAHRHVNGEGWVADTAKVADSVFVGKKAAVYHRAEISGGLEIKQYAAVCGAAKIAADGYISEDTFVAGSTNIKGTIWISGYARLYGGTFVGSNTVSGHVRVHHRPFVRDSKLHGYCFIAGTAKINNSTVDGLAMVGGNAIVSFSTINKDTRVAGSALVVSSVLKYTNRYCGQAQTPADTCLLITDEAKIVGVGALDALLHVKGRGVIVGGNIVFAPTLDADRNAARIECIDSLCVPNAEIRTLVEFDMFNNTDVLQRRGTAAAVLANAQKPFNLDNIVPRRRLSSTST